jgi:tRNA(His) 5'-end guanylyltransferase
MDETTKFLCQNIQGAKIGYVQSDEISLVLTDFDDLNTSAWFDNNIQKIASVAASMATAKFNQLRFSKNAWTDKLAFFDARVFQVPTKTEAINYLIWRQNDATRNSISSVAQSMYSHKELHGKSSNQMQEMIFQNGLNWNDLPTGLKRGRVICRQQEDSETTFWDKLTVTPRFSHVDNELLCTILKDNL